MSYLLHIKAEPKRAPVLLSQDHLDALFALGEAHPLRKQRLRRSGASESFGTIESVDGVFMWGSEEISEGQARVLFDAGLSWLLANSLADSFLGGEN